MLLWIKASEILTGNGFIKFCLKLLLLQMIIATSACGSKSSAPKFTLNIPLKWQQNSNIQSNKNNQNSWWENLNDPILNQLIDVAISKNYDLKIAKERIIEARAIKDKNIDQLFPNIGLKTSYSNSKQQDSSTGSNLITRNKSSGITGSLQLDIFSFADKIKEEDIKLKIKELEYRQTLNNLIAEIATTYTDMRMFQNIMILTKEKIEIKRKAVQAKNLQYNLKSLSKFDILLAETELKQAISNLPEIESSLAISQNKLSILTGENPDNLKRFFTGNAVFPSFKDGFILSTPIEVMTSRPDIQIAEYKFKDATLLKNITSSQLFPQISISSFFGRGATNNYNNLPTWNLGIDLILPLLNFTQIQKQINAASSIEMQAFYTYQQSILEALNDVENKFISYIHEEKHSKILDQLTNDKAENLRIYHIKYKLGDFDYFEILNANELYADAKKEAIISKANVTKNIIALQLSLGI